MFRAQLVELWDELLALTEADPDFRFLMDGQTVVIDDFLAVRPEARPRVERAVRGGQIQVGPWYTLPDEFLVSGETLVRDLQRGIADGDAVGGSLRVGYLPDSFGHAAQMPQIYRQFGLSHAVVWRGVPSAIDRLTFQWEAPDGTSIPTAYMANSYSHGVDLPLSGPELAARIGATLPVLDGFGAGDEVLLMNGNDHVLPQRRLAAAVRESNAHLGTVRARLSRLDDYLGTLVDDGWPRWQGELRASSRANVLMGTLSARIPDKQLYFRATLALERKAEPLVALTGLPAAGFLREAWTAILQNAAHDTACGSGIDEVSEEARLRSRAAMAIAEQVAGQALRRLIDNANAAAPAGREADAFVWNPSAFSRQGLIELEVEQVAAGAQDLGPASDQGSSQRLTVPASELSRLFSALDETRITGDAVRQVDFERAGPVVRVFISTARGGPAIGLEPARRKAAELARADGVERFEVMVQPSARRRALIPTGPVAGLGLGQITPAAGRSDHAPGTARASGRSIENAHIVCSVEDDGTLTLEDRESDTVYKGLHRLVDEGDAGDEYNFSPPPEQTVVSRPAQVMSVDLLQAGPLRATLEIRLRFEIPASLDPHRRARDQRCVSMPTSLRVTLDAGSHQLDCQLGLTNEARDHRLRLHCPLPFAVTHSEADGPYHVARRPAMPAHREAGAGEWELPAYPMRTFVDVSDGRRGFAILPEGLHEYEILPGTPPVLAVTLLRSVGWLSRDDLSLRQGHAGPPLATPGAQVQGQHRFAYSLRPHAGTWESAGIWRAAEAARLPLEVIQNAHAGRLSPGVPAIELNPESIQMTACVPGPNGFDLRLLNASSRPQLAEVRLGFTPAGVELVSLGGTERDGLDSRGSTCRVRLRPWEIATLRVRRFAR